MQIIHDIIAAVVGPGWKYGLSRILVNEDNVGVVFVAGSETPLAEFTVVTLSASKGTGVTADGGEITWRRRGSSCQYKLAKCKINTATMTEWWIASQSETDGEVVEGEVIEGQSVEGEVIEGQSVEGEPDASKGDVVVEETPEVVVEETPEVVVEETPEVVVEKPKRTRRTKVQIEADKAAAEAEDIL